MSSALQSTNEFLSSQLKADRVRAWGVRSGLSILDQGLTSGAGFVLNLVLARWLTSEAYGAFAVAFATLQFFFGFHNVLLIEPMSVMGPANYSRRILAYFRAQLQVQMVLSAVLSLLMFATAAIMSRIGVQHELVMAIGAAALAFPLILLLWLVRRMCYVVQRPAIATWASAFYLCLMLIGLFALRTAGWLDAATAVLLMAVVSVPAAVVPIRMLGIIGTEITDPCPWKQILRENWTYGRWLVASTALFSVASQTQTYLAAALLGLGAAGVLRAMQIPSLVMTQLVTAISLLLLPAMAYEFGLGQMDRLRRKAVFASVVLSTIAIVYTAVLGIFAKSIENVMYGGKFASSAWLIPVLGLVPVCTGLATGFSMALRACQKPHFDLLANTISAPVGLVTAILFIKFWGLGGAGISLVAGFAAYAGVFLWSFNRWTRQKNDVIHIAA